MSANLFRARALARRPSIAVLASALLAVSACGGNGGDAITPTPTPAPTPSPTPSPTPTPTPAPASTEHIIAATSANPAATQVSFDNVAYNPDPTVTAKGRLFLFLPGTNGTPAGYERIVHFGASRGYHTIGLAYPDDVAVDQACPSDPDTECASKLREEVLTGQSLSSHVSVDVPNSVIQRLTDLLAYLDKTYPLEGWGQYLSNGAINWSLVTVAGHSQGAGHAAYLGKMFAVNRVAMFSGVADLGPDGKTAPWLFRAGKTSAAVEYGFGHERDPLVPLQVQRNSWTALGMDAYGGLVSVDTTSTPFNNTHELSTNAEPQAQSNPNPPATIYHSVPITDGATPLTTQNNAVFLPVWAYMAVP